MFKREDVPVSMGLIIDNSGSMRDKRAKVEAAAAGPGEGFQPGGRSLHRQFQRRSLPRLPTTRTSPTTSRRWKRRLTRIDSRGGTAMRDAIRMSIDHLKEKANRDKKVLVVVTDGNDNSSMISLENLVKAAQQSDVLIYAVGLLSEEERREAKRGQARPDATWPRPPAARPISPRNWPKWTASRTRWRTISATSTPSRTARRTPRWTALTARSRSR